MSNQFEPSGRCASDSFWRPSALMKLALVCDRIAVFALALGLTCLAASAAPQFPRKPAAPVANPKPAAKPGEPCCKIISTNAAARLVAAKDNATGSAFEFSVPNSVAIQSLRVAQSVWADFKARKVSLDGQTTCCDIVSISVANAAAPAAASPALGPACCSITEINLSTRLVEAKEDATAKFFEFPVTDARRIHALHTGQAVWADFKARKVSLDGRNLCCDIVAFGQISVGAKPGAFGAAPQSVLVAPGQTGPGQRPQIQSRPGSPKGPATGGVKGGVIKPGTTLPQPTTAVGGKAVLTAVVTSVNPRTGLATAQDRATGRKFHFLLEKPGAASSVAVGTPVYADLTTRQISLDNTYPAGAMVSPMFAKVQGTPLALRFPALISANLPRSAMWHPPQAGASTSRGAPQLSSAFASATAPGATASTGRTGVQVVRPPSVGVKGLGNLNLPVPVKGYSFENIDVPGAYTGLDWLLPAVSPFAVNDRAEIVGDFMVLTNDWLGFGYRGFLKAASRYSALTYESYAINDRGLIAGTYSDSNLVYHGYIASIAHEGIKLDPNKGAPNFTILTTLDAPGACKDSGTFASGINDSGQVVGSFLDSDCKYIHGFLYSGGTYKQLDFPGASDTMPAGINDSGQVVGFYDVVHGLDIGPPHGFLYANGSYRALAVPGGVSMPLGINNLGSVIGVFNVNPADPYSVDHCFVEANGTFSQIDVPGSVGTYCYGMNSGGQVVGEYAFSDDPRGFDPNFYGFVATPPQSSLVCSTKPNHLAELVAQGVMVPSGATIYCRLRLKGALVSPSDLVITTSNPTVARATRPSRAIAGAGDLYQDVDFEVSTQPIKQTFPLTISASWGATTTSTTVTLAQSAIRDIQCLSYVCQGPPDRGYVGSLNLQLSGPAGPDGLQLQITGSDGYSGQMNVAAGSDRAEIWPPLRPVTVETPVTYSLRDPFDGSARTAKLVSEPPTVFGVLILDVNGGYHHSISNVPPTGTQVKVWVWVEGDPPPGGIPFQVQYDSSPNIMTGPATITYSSSTGLFPTFPATVLPCGANPPCTATVNVGGHTATISVNP
jgi:probable HAF family extracellular repeat protein